MLAPDPEERLKSAVSESDFRSSSYDDSTGERYANGGLAPPSQAGAEQQEADDQVDTQGCGGPVLAALGRQPCLGASLGHGFELDVLLALRHPR